MDSEDIPALLQRNDLPPHPGVYRFYNAGDSLLYVGKSIHLFNRVNDHYQQARNNRREAQLMSSTFRLGWTETAGEIGALLLENRQIKSLSPIYNRRLRRRRALWTLATTGDPERPVAVEVLDASRAGHTLNGLFNSKDHAVSTLKRLAADAGLCKKILGLEPGTGRCFDHQLNRCRGACVGEETLDDHNARLTRALAGLQRQIWPCDAPIVIEEPGLVDPHWSDWHLVDQWGYWGSVAEADQIQTVQSSDPPGFDQDAYHIIRKALRDPALPKYRLDTDGTLSALSRILVD